MTLDELDAIVDGIAPIIQEHIRKELVAQQQRIATLENRAAVPGPVGERGDRGEKGDAGERGADGVVGAIGGVGPIGLTGDRGDKGDSGEKGDAGPAGERGTGIVVGRGAPTADGRSGDVYLDVESGAIYQCQ